MDKHLRDIQHFLIDRIQSIKQVDRAGVRNNPEPRLTDRNNPVRILIIVEHKRARLDGQVPFDRVRLVVPATGDAAVLTAVPERQKLRIQRTQTVSFPDS